MKVVIAQLNPTVGDIEGNLKKIEDTLQQTKGNEPDLVVFSELYLTGYPPRDLLERAWFIDKVEQAVERLVFLSKDYPATGLLVGVPTRTGKQTGKGLYNTALLIHDGQVIFSQNKSLLPTYDVFDEARYFDAASKVKTVRFKDEVLGISVCEDAWNDSVLWRRGCYEFDPISELAKQGATVLINISASPFQVGKEEIRFNIVRNHSKKHGLPFVYVNQVGGNDEIVFDGRSFFIGRSGEPAAILPALREHVQIIDTKAPGVAGSYAPQEKIESLYEALVLGIRDYMGKCGFKKAVLGLSGGIDSAVVCSLATAAIGQENVMGVTMPSHYSSAGSVDDSRKLAENLGIEFKTVPIASIFNAYVETLAPQMAGEVSDITEENIQARIRGNILMALSNKYGSLLLSTGNKSELAVGYCTLYGDMSGGLSVISDVPKTMVYQLARYINSDKEIIPNETIVKPPSAELKPDQVDQDTLPPYETLDEILRLYVDEGYSVQEILDKKFDPEIVKWVIGTVDRNEYKRKQAAPGLKVTTKAFGVGRRMPIAARYCHS